MSKKKKNKKIPLQSPEASGFGMQLGALLQKQGLAPEKKEESPSQAPKQPAQAAKEDAWDLAKSSKVTLMRETKRRRGKTVTVVKGLSLSSTQMNSLAKELRKTMGCGSSVEEQEIVLQGDLRQRIKGWLEEKGVKKVVISGG